MNWCCMCQRRRNVLFLQNVTDILVAELGAMNFQLTASQTKVLITNSGTQPIQIETVGEVVAILPGRSKHKFCKTFFFLKFDFADWNWSTPSAARHASNIICCDWKLLNSTENLQNNVGQFGSEILVSEGWRWIVQRMNGNFECSNVFTTGQRVEWWNFKISRQETLNSVGEWEDNAL